MPEKGMRATLDTTVILGAVGNPLGPNASVIAHGLVGIYSMVLAQSVIAEALRHLRRGFGKIPPLSERQIETLFATLFQHRWEPQILRQAPPTTLNTTAVQHELLGN
jgi:predicted nucleic acid-binding protein